MADIITVEDVFKMLDAKVESIKWDAFYTERKRPAPFILHPELPDESLKEYFESGRVKPETALELGCGEGRNAFYMAKRGCHVTAVDSSETAIRNAVANDEKQRTGVNFICKSIFDLPIEANTYDFVYDSGLLHHLAPHRRLTYIQLINNVLKSRGHFGLTCFAWGENVGEEVDDWEYYEKRRTGVAFTEEKLNNLFGNSMKLVEIRKMKDDVPDTLQGMSFMWAALFQKK